MTEQAERMLDTEQVKILVVGTLPDFYKPSDAERAAAFDRWLAAHDAQVLRDAAFSGDYGTTAQSALLARADRIAGGTTA